MDAHSLDFLKRLMGAISPSGHELDAVRVFRDEARQFAADVRTDVHGNTDVVINPGGSPRDAGRALRRNRLHCHLY